MSEKMEQFLRLFYILSGFAIPAFVNYSNNLKRSQRHKQLFMPLLGTLLTVVAVVLVEEWFRKILEVLLAQPQRLDGLASSLAHFVSVDWSVVSDTNMSIQEKIRELDLKFWAFYGANLGILFAYQVIKPVMLLILRLIMRSGSALLPLAGIFYTEDEKTGVWTLQSRFCQGRTLLKVLYFTALTVSLVCIGIAPWLYRQEYVTELFYPVVGVILLGELCALLNGVTRKELRVQAGVSGEEPEEEVDYASMRQVLRGLFGDKLNAQDTTVSEPDTTPETTEELLTRLENSDSVALEGYGRFMRRKVEAGLEPDYNYLLSGQQLLQGKSVLFNDPFYYDLVPYIFYPMNRSLLRHKKVLVISGRHGTEERVQQWCTEGLTSVTNLPSMWEVGVLSGEKKDLHVGIVSRSSVHDLQMHEANRDFFEEVGFVVLLEPSRLVTTAQVGLNSLVRHCRKGKKKLVFCSMDKNCDGLVDSLSHILMTSLREVSATNHHKGASSYMIWEADAEHLQHRMLPNLSRYLGIGTELSFAALKHRIPETVWCGGDAFPVVDIHWIAKQYYYDLLRYAGLPATQENMDKYFRVCPDIWGLDVAKNRYITVEDESFNMFEVKRAFSTRATDQGFVNVICREYLLKDYMAANNNLFNADPKAIPYITADYARTKRNMVLRLCLRMSTGLVPEREIRRELTMMDCASDSPAESLWNEICATCGYVGEQDEDRDGRLVLRTQGGNVSFTDQVLQRRRRFNMETGSMEDMYFIADQRFIRLVLGALRPAEYVAEDENGQREFLGTELQGHIFQKYLPGQLFTFGGKYYEMLRVTSQGQVLVRRASDHIEGRPSYRQVRNYTLIDPVDSAVMGECRDMGLLRFTRQFADIRVETPAYWSMKRHNDFSTAAKVTINGIPDRVYNHKGLLRIDIAPGEVLPEGTVSTLAVLINEVLRTLLAENQDYLVAVTAGDARLPGTYSLQGSEALPLNSIYLIEDSQMDIGLLDAVERNMGRIFAIICDYLQWHEEALADKQEPRIIPGPAPAPEGEEVPAQPKKECFLVRFFRKLFGGIKAFFRKLFAPFAKLGRKKKPEAEPEAVPQTDPAAPQGDQGATEYIPQDDPGVTEFVTPEDGETQEGGEIPVTRPVEPEETADIPVTQPVEPVSEEETGDIPRTVPVQPLESRMLFCQAGDAPMDTAAGSDNDTLDYEPETVYSPETPAEPGKRPAYKDRCYLRYGDEAIAANLDLAGVQQLLRRLGFRNNPLTQARKGMNVAERIGRTFDPSKSPQERCDFCGSELTGNDYVVLGDGRSRCSECSRTAVKSLEEFVSIHDTVLRNLRLFFGIRINAPVRVQMVNSKKLHRKLGKSFVPSPKMDGRVLGVAIKDRKGYTILVENGAPRLNSTMTMVHEMIHIWQYTHWDMEQIKNTYGQDELEIYEGMAKWVEIQYTYLIGETAAAKQAELLTLFSDPPYGPGFRKFLEKYPLDFQCGDRGATPFDDLKKPL